MPDAAERLIMQVAEPWDFADGPVHLAVQERTSPDHWIVTVLSGWPDASEAVLAARYEGETLLLVFEGREVVANLTSTDRPAPLALSGTVRAEPVG
jgi:hypothetical protein